MRQVVCFRFSLFLLLLRTDCECVLSEEMQSVTFKTKKKRNRKLVKLLTLIACTSSRRIFVHVNTDEEPKKNVVVHVVCAGAGVEDNIVFNLLSRLHAVGRPLASHFLHSLFAIAGVAQLFFFFFLISFVWSLSLIFFIRIIRFVRLNMYT